jgi:hypothetical protein
LREGNPGGEGYTQKVKKKQGILAQSRQDAFSTVPLIFMRLSAE